MAGTSALRTSGVAFPFVIERVNNTAARLEEPSPRTPDLSRVRPVVSKRWGHAHSERPRYLVRLWLWHGTSQIQRSCISNRIHGVYDGDACGLFRSIPYPLRRPSCLCARCYHPHLPAAPQLVPPCAPPIRARAHACVRARAPTSTSCTAGRARMLGRVHARPRTHSPHGCSSCPCRPPVYPDSDNCAHTLCESPRRSRALRARRLPHRCAAPLSCLRPVRMYAHDYAVN